MKRTFIGLVVAFGACVAPAHAAFHLFRIDQVFSNADGTVQYVVMRESTGSDFENQWAGNSLSTTGAGAMQFRFPSNLPSTLTHNRSVLIATTGFAALNVVTPDYTIPNGFIPMGGGTLSYASGTDMINLPALPTDGVTAINRNGTPMPATPTNFAGATATLTPPVPVGPDLDQHGLTGSWYNPATSGQGLEIEVFPDLSAPGTGLTQASWFTFDTTAGGEDRQRWYTLSGPVVTGQPSAALTIYQNIGGNFNAAPTTTATAVGTATLSFDSCTTGQLMYTFSDGTGRAGTVPLTRLTQNVTCSVDIGRPLDANFAHSGNWYAAATSGQGFTVEVNPNSSTLFFAWYTYAPSGAGAGAAGQRWYTGQGTYTAGAASIPVQLFETTGGAFNAPAPTPATVPVGTATLTFQNCSSATLNFTFTGGSSSGASGTIALGRIGPVPPGCS